MIRCWFLVLPFVIATVAAATYGDTERLTRLTRQLGSIEFAEREAAERELEAAGPPALPILKRAADTDDPEIRRRAEALVQQIEKRIEAAKLLESPPLRLVYRDMPLNEAVADFNAKTGILCQIGHESAKGTPTANLLGRKITLDTGDVSAWEAFHEFCRAAGVVEKHLVEQKSAPNRDVARQEADAAWVIRRQVVASSGQVQSSLARSILIDGTPPSLPTYIAGPLRFRVLTPQIPQSSINMADGEVQFSLEVTNDSKLSWLHFGNLRIDKAVDDQGQVLTPMFGITGLASAAQTPEEIIWVDGSGSGSSPVVAPYQNIPVRLKLGQQPSRKLREFRGTISAQVQTAPEPLISVENLLEAAGKTVRGVDGCSMEVREVVHDDNGELTIRATVRVPLPPTNWNPVLRPVRVRVARGKASTTTQGNGTTNPYIVDADGKSHFAKVDTNPSVTPDANVYDVRLTCQVPRSRAETAKLVYTGPRTLVIDVPFEFKDLPLR